MELEPYQVAAITRLRDSLVDMDSYDSVPSDDSLVTVEDDNTYTQLVDEGGQPLSLGHLRAILSVFSE